MDEHSLLEDEKDMEEAIRDEDWADEEFISEMDELVEDNESASDVGFRIGEQMAYKDFWEF